ncbi:MAG: hypothetical protein LBV58_00175 [Acholeplasmatales bacterium]|jgi:glutamyl aminopeptidase|nr:hypothetical protein [Acholeplasmatales bacterium]
MKLEKEFVDLLNIFSPSSNEDGIFNYFLEFIKKHENFTVLNDKLGSIYGYKKGTSSEFKVMISSHSDEVSYQVKEILDKGILKIENVGRIASNYAIGSVLTLYSGKNKYKGVVIVEKIEETIDNLYFDIGAISKDEIISLGIRIGDFLSFDKEIFYSSNDLRFFATGIDNKFGCYTCLKLLSYFNDISLPFDLYIGTNVMEEVGTRGAITASNLINPDIFINLDASPINDLFNSTYSLEKGPFLRVKDPEFLIDKNFLDYLHNLFAEKKFNYQDYFATGGTDARKIHLNGTGSIGTTIALPTRFIHTGKSEASFKDLNESFKIVKGIIEDLNVLKIKKLIRK